jgi:hypothetical protein
LALPVPEPNIVVLPREPERSLDFPLIVAVSHNTRD